MQLSIVRTISSTEPKRATLQLIGSLDLGTRSALLEAASAALEAAGELHLDASAIDFIDSVGISSLTEVAHLARKRGAAFSLDRSSPQMERVLGYVGLADAWTHE